MKTILKWLTPIISIGVLVFILFFLISINTSPNSIQQENIFVSDKIEKKEPKKIWLDSFSKNSIKSYAYPVTEVYLEIDLDEQITNTITYELSASLLDQYQLFCLKEELKRHKLRYNLKKYNDRVELLIYSQNRQKLNSLVEVLKDYQIFAKIKRHKDIK